jgi:hypothetical protein
MTTEYGPSAGTAILFSGWIDHIDLFVQVEGGVTIGNRSSTFDGLIGMLERGEIDVALADLSLTPARYQVGCAGFAKKRFSLQINVFFRFLRFASM